MLYSLFALLLAAAIIKIIQLKKAAREISAAFADRLQTDTNTQIDISSRDKDMCRLASAINTQLRILRQEHLRYHQGDTELKNAVTNISHDLRTPLTAICGYIDIMEKTEISEQQARYLGIIKERTELMKQLTEELFRYSVIVSDDEKTETETILINQVLEDSIMGYYAVLTEKGIHPDVNITDKQITAELNKEYLSRIFSNLLNNAVKYSDGDLDIILSDTGEIIFSNTAKGLSAVDAEQLFDRFYTVEAAHHSTGLGLSIARTLVRRMGGTITAEYADSRLKIKIKF
ncbi:MAG: HAMP domain-containing sensor histidine kinase [Oscillospiraceae bacterium]|nr:HAMP domain-containing sensor histidine kinase [Oscillospiraceae bacterium]